MASQSPPQILKAKKNDRPRIADILNFVIPYVHHKWYNLGLQLLDSDDSETFLHGLRTQHQNGLDLCREVFIHWLEVDNKATWGKILEALNTKSVNLISAADNINKLLDKRNLWQRGMHKVSKKFSKGSQTLPPIVETHPTSNHTDRELRRSNSLNIKDDSTLSDTEGYEYSEKEFFTASYSPGVSPSPTHSFPRSLSLHVMDDRKKYHDIKPVQSPDDASPFYDQPRMSSSVPANLDATERPDDRYNHCIENPDQFKEKYMKQLEVSNNAHMKLCKTYENENKELKTKLAETSEENSELLKQVEKLKEEVQIQKVSQEKQLSDVTATLGEIQDENKALKAKQDKITVEMSNLAKENQTLVEQNDKITKQLEEAGIVQEKELSNMKTKMDKEKSAAIAKEREYQNLLKEKEKFLEAAKKHNHVLLSENTRIHSAMQELQDAYNQITQLKEDIQKLTYCVKQISQEIIQKFPLLKLKVEENIILKNKADHDCSSVMCECGELTRKVNALLHENRCLSGN